MSESQLEAVGVERVAGALTVLSELVVVGVVLWVFADDVVMLGAGALWVLVSAPVLYVALARAFRESV
ncbi:hypothetical protein [Halorubellus litoreus]|uniref:Uncharacterized protein n=1 Tax=Halorubellus litoreus TaxID=755308 RepID=A0ABD5VGI2_9EURY